ncbi:unnamed protein product [Caretta caretta]
MDKHAKASRLLSGGKGERRLSMFEKDSHAQLLKDRMRNSSHEVHGMEPMDGESFAEFGKSEIFTLKTSMAKIKYANTYRMEPYRKFQAHLVRNKAQLILTMSSRWVWDVARDNWVSAKCETESFISLALIMACYYE